MPCPVVIKLEGGSDEDIKLLDAPPTATSEEDANKDKKTNENDEEKASENGNGEVGISSFGMSIWNHHLIIKLFSSLSSRPRTERLKNAKMKVSLIEFYLLFGSRF